jgi:hypothetical protein
LVGSDDHLSAAMAREADQALLATNSTAPETGKIISKVYRAILEKAEWAESTLTPAQRQRVIKLREELFDQGDEQRPKLEYQRYISLKKAFEEQQAAWDTTPEDQRTDRMRVRLERARSQLQQLGDTSRFLGIESELTLLSVPKPTEVAQELRDMLNAARRQEPTEHYSVVFVPQLPTLFDEGGWTRIRDAFTMSSEACANERPQSILLPPADFMLLRAYASDTVTPIATHKLAIPNGTRIEIAFDLLVAAIRRPWFQNYVFESRAWRWPEQDPPIHIVSLGQPVGAVATSDKPQQMMAVADTFYIIRGAELKNVLDAQTFSWLRQQRAVGHNVYFGPFQLTGAPKIMGQAQSSTVDYLQTGRKLITGHMQLAAYRYVPIPLTPNPDPDFIWKPAQ